MSLCRAIRAAAIPLCRAAVRASAPIKVLSRNAAVSSVKPREFDGKRIMGAWLKANADSAWTPKLAQVNPTTDLDKLPEQYPWLLETNLVCKIDQLIKRRGKGGNLCLNKSWADVKKWLETKRGKEIKVEQVSGLAEYFLIEPFVVHKQSDEYYFCIRAGRDGDEILFYNQGGINVGAVDEKAQRCTFAIDEMPSEEQLNHLVKNIPEDRKAGMIKFINGLVKYSRANHLTFMEINPIVMLDDGSVHPLDMAAKIDETVKFECAKDWGNVVFPPAFGKIKKTPEEEFVEDLDSRSGASLKLQLLRPENPNPRLWTMIAGGGASVIFTDTIFELGWGKKELANYGEYSGDPSEELTFQYAKTIFGLMTKQAHPDGKILLLAGGIANFTDVAATFKGIIRAIRGVADKLRDQKVQIWIRRGGPNFQQGLRMMQNLRDELKLDIRIYGPELHLTEICSLALGMQSEPFAPKNIPVVPEGKEKPKIVPYVHKDAPQLFTNKTRCFIYGMQNRAVQSMMDFDYCGGREKPSVAAIIYEFQESHVLKFFWGTKEVLVPVCSSLAEAIKRFPEVDTVVNFMSQRAAYDATMACMKYPQIKNITVIAEGVPERRARAIVHEANKKGVVIIGPATVGGLKPGCFRIGNTVVCSITCWLLVSTAQAVSPMSADLVVWPTS